MTLYIRLHKILDRPSSKNNDPLLQLLKDVDKDCDVQFITNIPSRVGTYQKNSNGDAWRSNASKNINSYLTKLNPETFDGPITPYFNFHNHSKIIGTENKVYIGSENFSVESKKNYEAGVIIEDKQFIKELYVWFDKLRDESIPYFNDDYNQLRLFIISILARLMTHYEHFIDSLFRIRKDGEAVFINEETTFNENDLYELLYSFQELSDIQGLVENIEPLGDELNDNLEQLLEIFENMPINNIVEFLAIDGPIYEYIAFDVNEKTLEIFQDEYNSMADDGEKLEHYMEISSDEANDSLVNICNEIESDLYSVKSDFEEILEGLKKMDGIIKDIAKHSVNPLINNT
ncbi:hypothetical protein EHV15_33050 [Paenibacillus oralis]|uniref:PLD phosphodiesterase domain-containing protein n=1 Tax=Paenibacillus oralis TaxID=2490856 RepID=A0A3P3UC63_9BACL|nr:hypothetical protein EHV15_33050 [Paenibacillus oralis]